MNLFSNAIKFTRMNGKIQIKAVYVKKVGIIPNIKKIRHSQEFISLWSSQSSGDEE